MGGFDRLDVGPLAMTYFKDVVATLTKEGESVFATEAPPYAGTEARAAVLAEQIDAILAHTGKAKVNLVGHSQGGLDARVLTSPNGLGYGDRVASITTIATPHRGSKVADVTLAAVARSGGDVDALTASFLSLLQKTAYDVQNDPALHDQLVSISEEHMRETFNPKYVDDPRVVYRSYAGRSNLRAGVAACAGSTYPNDPNELDRVAPSLFLSAILLEGGEEKVNDGLVTVESARWGTFEQCVPADHADEIAATGAGGSFDHLAFFEQVVARIRQAGE
jgi:triacylglycerol lipase